MSKESLEDRAAAVEKIQPDFIHKDGSLVFVNPSVGIRYYKQQLVDIENRWEAFNELSVEEMNAQSNVLKHLRDGKFEADYRIIHYRAVLSTGTEYTYLVDLLAKAETTEEVNALDTEFATYHSRRRSLLRDERSYFMETYLAKLKSFNPSHGQA